MRVLALASVLSVFAFAAEAAPLSQFQTMTVLIEGTRLSDQPAATPPSDGRIVHEVFLSYRGALYFCALRHNPVGDAPPSATCWGRDF